LALPLILTSLRHARPPRPSTIRDNTALVIASLDNRTCEMIQPTATAPSENNKVLAKEMKFPQHQTAVVILEITPEPQWAISFRARGTPLFHRPARSRLSAHSFFSRATAPAIPKACPRLSNTIEKFKTFVISADDITGNVAAFLQHL